MKKIFTMLAVASCLAVGNRGQAQVIYSENFESASYPALPSGFTQNVTPDDSTGWHTGDSAAASSTSFKLPAHGHFAYVNDDAYAGANNGNVLMKTPNFSLASASNPYLSFDLLYFQGTYGGFTEGATVEVSYDTGATWTVLATLAANTTAPWEPRYISLSAAAGHSAVMLGFRYKDNTGWLFGIGVDNISVFTPPANDLALTAVAPTTGTPPSYGLGGSNINLLGQVFNMGGTTVTSYNVNYVFNGGSVVTSTMTASIAPFTSATFTATTPVTLPTAVGQYPVRMWVSLSGDANNANDTAATQMLNTVAFMPTKKIAFEEATGTWCGWCVRGIVYMDSLRALYGNGVSLVAVHNSDPMVVSAYDSWIGGFISGYPSVVVDRTTTVDPSDILDVYTQHHNDFGFADITATATIASGSVSVAASVKPAINLSGNYRLALVLTEDRVHGTAAGWEQHNYYSGSSSLTLSGGGINYVTQPSTIPATDMYYEHVARSITPGVSGAASSALPATMTAGTNYPLTLTGTVASGWNLNYMHAVVLLIDVATGRVMNSQSVVLTLGVDNVAASLSGVSVYPNPATNNAFVQFGLQNSSKVSIEVYDVTGRKVSAMPTVELAAGTQNIEMTTGSLVNGIYTVKIITEEGTATQTLSIAK